MEIEVSIANNVIESQLLHSASFNSQLFASDNLAGDEFLHDLVAAAVDGLHACVNKGAGDGIFPHVTPASVKL